MSVSNEKEIVNLLDQILKVLALLVAADQSLTERARLLKLAGMDNRTIAEVLNTSDATIRTLTANLRRRETKQKRRVSRRHVAAPFQRWPGRSRRRFSKT